MTVPKIHALNFALKYAPPTLVMHYYTDDNSEEFAHQVRVLLKKNAAAVTIANELIREEPLYFSSEVVQKEQLVRLIQKLIDNNGKKIGNLKLQSRTALMKVQESLNDSERELEDLLADPLNGKFSEEKFNDLQKDDQIKASTTSEEALSSPEENEEDVIVGEAGEGEAPIVLRKVMLEDINQEVLMDDQGNLYDMEGHYMGRLDEEEQN